jgi:hypothetical protein
MMNLPESKRISKMGRTRWMKTQAPRLVLTLLAIALSSPAFAQEAAAAKACKTGSTSAKCLLQTIKTLQAQVATLQMQVTTLQNNHALALGPYVSVDPGTERGLKGPQVIFSGANVHIESGSGATVDTTGLGNLVVGYDEDSLAPSAIDSNRTGSHNLVVGPQHEFTASAGMVSGYANFTSAVYASITGGECNAAGSTVYPIECLQTLGISDAASVSGGDNNTASGFGSSVSGGGNNTASGGLSSVTGGSLNTASGGISSVSGGYFNTAGGGGEFSTENSSVSGGYGNTASGDYSSVGGGESNMASGPESSLSGGENNVASGQLSSVSGGASNAASGLQSSVSGGANNSASGALSSILGGDDVTVSTAFDTSP